MSLTCLSDRLMAPAMMSASVCPNLFTCMYIFSSFENCQVTTPTNEVRERCNAVPTTHIRAHRKVKPHTRMGHRAAYLLLRVQCPQFLAKHAVQRHGNGFREGVKQEDDDSDEWDDAVSQFWSVLKMHKRKASVTSDNKQSDYTASDSACAV